MHLASFSNFEKFTYVSGKILHCLLCLLLDKILSLVIHKFDFESSFLYHTVDYNATHSIHSKMLMENITSTNVIILVEEQGVRTLPMINPEGIPDLILEVVSIV